MKIEYKILWLDDKASEIHGDEWDRTVENYLSDLGFQPFIELCSKKEDFFTKLDDSYDLIMTDYNLEESLTGDKIVEEIRSKSVFTEILFYTANANLQDTNKIDRTTFVETSKKTGKHYDVLIIEVKKLIDLTVKKFQHIVSMRGMIMHETSSLDVEFEEILQNFIEKKLDESQKTDAINKIKSRYNESLTKIEDSDSDLTKILNKIGAFHRWRALKRILKSSLDLDFENICNVLGEYDKEIIQYRNKFAHAVLEKDKNGKDIFRGSKETFDAEKCITIRKNIQTHKKNLDDLKSKIIQ